MVAMKLVAKDRPLSRNAKRGRPVRGSRTGRPMMVLLDLLGRRWALRVIWELREDRVLTFRDLQAACAIAPSVLNTRISELAVHGILVHTGTGYALTSRGLTLLTRLLPLH